MRTVLAVLASAPIFLAPELAAADPAPKVCVVVAGDPDVGVRAIAEALSARIAARTDLRGVADPSTTATLRGEAGAPTPTGDAGGPRRSLDGSAGDATGLATLATPLGCALVVEVVSRPTGIELRSFDVVHGAFVRDIAVASLDDPSFEQAVLVPARAALAPAPTPIPPHPVAPGPVRVRVAGSSASAPRRADPRVSTRPIVTTGGGAGLWPWLIAGSAALGLVVGFVVLQNSGPSTPVLTVSHPAATGASP